jgi:serine/threonine protein kinase
LADDLRHDVLALLGQGNMGAVYKARHTKMDQLVPLKVIIGLAEILAGLLTPAQ